MFSFVFPLLFVCFPKSCLTALNVLSVAEIEEREPLDLEVHYMGESREGELLTVLHAREGSVSYMKILNGSGRAVFEMKLSFR